MANVKKRTPSKKCGPVKDPRPSWDEYFMDLAMVVAKRSNCSRRNVAAIVVSNHRVISTGYNGTPRGVKNCFDGGCPRCASTVPSGSGLDECLCVHAEQNAICQAAFYGTRLEGATIYVTLCPCLTCAKLIVNAGIVEVVYAGDYKFEEQVEKLFKEAGVKCRQYIPKGMEA